MFKEEFIISLKEEEYNITTLDGCTKSFDGEDCWQHRIGSFTTTKEGKFVNASIVNDEFYGVEDIDDALEVLNYLKEYIEKNGIEEEDEDLLHEVMEE